MKSQNLVLTATALVGFAAGWVLKPSPEPQPSEITGTADAGKPKRLDSKVRERETGPLILKARASGPAEADPERVSADLKFQREFGSATDRAENARLGRLEEALGLSPGQKEMMEVMLANRRDGFRQMSGAGKSQADMVQAAAASEQRFNEEVRNILDPEQVEALDAYRERERDNDIEARAQRDLADLIGQVDLSPAQRDEALEIFRAGSSAAASRRPAGWDLISESLGMMGGSHVTILEDMGDFLGDPEVMKDPQIVHQRLLESQRGAMTQKISGLTPILTPGQLAQYRATLSARSSFMEQSPPPTANQR